MTRVLLISGHPRFEQSKFSRPFIAALDGDRFHKKILVELYPDWQFEIPREQADLAASAAVVFVFPIYWYSPPAILQKWAEETLVATERFDPRTTLRNKKIYTVVSTGGTADDYTPAGQNRFAIADFLRSFEMTFRYMGCHVHAPHVTHATFRLTNADVLATSSCFAKALHA